MEQVEFLRKTYSYSRSAVATEIWCYSYVAAAGEPHDDVQQSEIWMKVTAWRTRHTHNTRIDRTMSNVDLNKTVKTAIIYVRIRDRLESKLDHFVAVSVSHNLTIFQYNEKSGARVRMLGSESLGQHRENDKQEEKRSLQRMSRRRSRKVKTGALVQNYTHTHTQDAEEVAAAMVKPKITENRIWSMVCCVLVGYFIFILKDTPISISTCTEFTYI